MALRRKGDSEAPPDENHGMPPLPKTFTEYPKLDAGIIPYIRVVLGEAGQMAYIEKKGAGIFDTHHVVIDVDCQFNRAGAIGFHKDSRGTTAFVNLTFENEDAMTGTDHYEDLEGDPGLEQSLPDAVRNDIIARRGSAIRTAQGQDQKAKAGVLDIHSPRLPAYGRLSFSDPNNYHSTPMMGHRTPTGDESVTMMRRVVFAMTKDGDWLGQGPDEVYAENAVRVEYEKAKDLYNSHGVEPLATTTASESDAMKQAAAKKNRRLSKRLTKGEAANAGQLPGKKITQDQLNEEAKTLRTFIRTWVRFVPKTGVIVGRGRSKSFS